MINRIILGNFGRMRLTCKFDKMVTTSSVWHYKSSFNKLLSFPALLTVGQRALAQTLPTGIFLQRVTYAVCKTKSERERVGEKERSSAHAHEIGDQYETALNRVKIK